MLLGIPRLSLRLDFHESSYRLYRDGVLLGTFSGAAGAFASRCVFGDNSGYANARVEIAKLEFLQGGATPARGTTWGRLKSLYH